MSWGGRLRFLNGEGLAFCSRPGLSFPATARWEGAVSPYLAGRPLVILLALAGPLMGADVLVAGLGVLFSRLGAVRPTSHLG